jgi:hypothetical protein
MAGEVKAAAEALEAALRTVDGLRVFRDPGATVDPPAAILGAPALGWRAFCPAPTSARFTVFVVVAANERAMEQLWDLVPVVAAAVEEQVQEASVRDGDAAALPTTFPTGGSNLPAYAIEIDYEL